MTCNDLLLPHVDWLLAQPPDPMRHTVKFFIAGMGQDADTDVGSYGEGSFGGIDSQNRMVGFQTQFFSDRRTATGQPFDQHNTDSAITLFSLPNGPLVFNHQDGSIIARFTNVECRDGGLLVWTADFTNTVLVMTLRNDTSQFVP